MPILVFFDTEFTALADDAALISIGLIDEFGQNYFYAELSDTYTTENCSEFCRQYVLPHLDEKNLMTLVELRLALRSWLVNVGTNVRLICDSKRDLAQLATIFPDGVPGFVSSEALGFWQNVKRRIFNMGRRMHRRYRLRVHHALDDAVVNCLIFSKSHIAIGSVLAKTAQVGTDLHSSSS